MLGAPFLLPLYADAGDAAAADAPDALHPLPARPQAEGACLEGQNARLAPQKFDVDRVARLLRGVAVCGSLCVRFWRQQMRWGRGCDGSVGAGRRRWRPRWTRRRCGGCRTGRGPWRRLERSQVSAAGAGRCCRSTDVDGLDDV